MNLSAHIIALFVPTLNGGGAERVTVLLANKLVELGYSVDLVLCEAGGVYAKEVDRRINIVELNVPRVAMALPALAAYLHRTKPNALVSAMSHANTIAIIAKILSGSKRTKILVVEHNTLSMSLTEAKSRCLKLAMKTLYPLADHIAGVSAGVARDLCRSLGFSEDRVQVLYNPVVSSRLKKLSEADPTHPWFLDAEKPVFIGLGRLTAQKNFKLLIDAFAIVKQECSARLVIFGEGELRADLEQQVAKLNLQDCVALPGFVENPFAHLRRSVAFVLSSRWEGLPTVLIEAMACGTRVISTDCPSGPNEILEHGRWGDLVPVDDKHALAEAMLAALRHTERMNIADRAAQFSDDAAAQRYLQLLGY